jgi:acyl dehydratase
VAKEVFADDLVEGAVYELGSYTVTRDDIVSFAQQWDPQDFHTDDAAAADGMFGEVIASGIHSLAVFQRLSVLGALNNWSVIAGRTMREVQFRSPVRAGTELFATQTVLEVIHGKPGRALVVSRGELFTPQATVLTLILEMYMRTRPTGG